MRMFVLISIAASSSIVWSLPLGYLRCTSRDMYPPCIAIPIQAHPAVVDDVLLLPIDALTHKPRAKADADGFAALPSMEIRGQCGRLPLEGFAPRLCGGQGGERGAAVGRAG